MCIPSKFRRLNHILLRTNFHFIPGHQTPQRESAAKPETHLHIIVSLEDKSGVKEVQNNKSNPSFENNAFGEERPRNVKNRENSIQYILH